MNFLKKFSSSTIAFHCIFIAVVYVILLIIRIPILINADTFLTVDEGFLASDMLDLFNGGTFSLYPENVSYAGIFSSLGVIPFFWAFGVSSLTFKLAGILYYALYIWTFFLLVKRLKQRIAWVSVFLLVLCPPNILTLSTNTYPHILIAVFANINFLIYFSNKDNPSHLKIFCLAFLMGFSLYIYTYSIIYIVAIVALWVMDTKISPRNILQSIKPTNTREYCARFIDVVILLNISWFFISLIAGGVSIKSGDFIVFNSFMRGITPNYLALNSGKVYVPFVELFLAIAFLRVVLYRGDILIAINSIKKSASSRLWGIGLFGFFIGLTPRWIGLYGNKIFGHPGYELDLGLSQMWFKLSDLVFAKLPKMLELNSYSGILLSLLIVIAIFNFLRRDKHKIEMIFFIIPIVLLLASIIYQKPNTIRHLFPFYGAIIFYLASFLFYIEKKSIYSYWLILLFLGGFYSYATYDYYKRHNIMKGFYPLQQDTNYDDLIKYTRKNNFQAVYTGYISHKLNFLSGGNPLFVEFHSNPFQGWKRRKKANLTYNNWTVLIPDEKNLKIYKTYLKTKKIDCNRGVIQGYIALSRCRGNPHAVSKLRFLGQF
jgi:hypothetical protein